MTAQKVWAALLAACLLLAGCRRAEITIPEKPPEDPPAAAEPASEPAEEPRAVILDHLTVELLVSWEDADRILENLEDLSRLLENALLALNCTIEEPAAITIGTASGVTSQALRQGGVDAAFLPAEDFAAMEDGAAIGVLMSSNQDFFLAVTTANTELDTHFRFVLSEALTDTEEGQSFLKTCYPGITFTAASEHSPES